QPESALSGWFRERFGSGGKRLRRIGIVAVGREIIIAPLRLLNTGGVPEGAAVKAASTGMRCSVRPRPGCWWRRPGKLPGRSKKPSDRWGRLLQAFQLSSQDAESIG